MVSPGTGAGIGIALALFVLLVVGPGAYYYRRRQRRRLAEAEHDQSRDAEMSQAGDEEYGYTKPQLDDTAVSPETAWRVSRSTVDDGPIAVSEVAGQERPGRTTGRRIDSRHQNASGSAHGVHELGLSTDGRRPELSAVARSPPPAELRMDKSPPANSGTQKDGTQILTEPVIEPREEFARSEDSIEAPPLPGPVLPPKHI